MTRRTGIVQLSQLALIVPAFIVLLPLALFLFYGFLGIENREIVYQVGWRNYAEFWNNDGYRGIFVKTLQLATEVAVLNTFLGFNVALLIWHAKGRQKTRLILATAIPLLMSYVIKIYAIRALLGYNGLLNGTMIDIGMINEPIEAFLYNMSSVRLTLSLVLLPFAILPIIVAMERIQTSLIHASSDMGATSTQTFLKVILPLSVPGVVTAFTFTFVLAAGDFLVPELVGGTNGFTYGRLIFSQFGLAFNWPLGAALSSILLLVSLSVVLIGRRLSNPKWLNQNA